MSVSHVDGHGVRRDAHDMVVLMVVDSHLVFADALAAQLRERIGPRAVHVAHSVGQARAILDGAGDDVVVLHDEMRTHDGMGMLQELAAQPDDVVVLVLSGTDDVGAIIDALRTGASGWISKDMDLEALTEAIAQVAEGHLYLSPPVMSSVLRSLLSSTPAHSATHGFVDSLTQREMEILRCLVAGMTKRQVADRLFLSIHTVRSHIQRMMHRADQHSTLALVAMARQVGVPPIEESALGGPGRHPGAGAES